MNHNATTANNTPTEASNKMLTPVGETAAKPTTHADTVPIRTQDNEPTSSNRGQASALDEEVVEVQKAEKVVETHDGENDDGIEARDNDADVQTPISEETPIPEENQENDDTPGVNEESNKNQLEEVTEKRNGSQDAAFLVKGSASRLPP